MKRIVSISFVFLMCVTSLAYSRQPVDALRGFIDRCVNIMKDPKYLDADQKDQHRERIWEVIHEFFDFTELAKRTIGHSWSIFTPDQRKEFTDVFAEFLGNMYLDKIDGKSEEQSVIYWSEEMITDSKALVRTKIATGTREIPVGYRVKKHNGTWKVYDVSIDGVSLVRNYRAQFQKILSKQSPGYLITRLKEKIKQQEKGRVIKD